MEFREMRRKKQLLSLDECVEVLKSNTSGVLSVIGDNGYPYGVPISYCYSGGFICFHCAKTGHKTDAIAADGKVSFCVIDKDDVVPEKYTTRYRSVIVFGKAELMTDSDKILAAIKSLAKKYSPAESDESIQREIENGIAGMAMIRLTPEHITGKIGLEILKERNKA